jgi:hypothetical protein
VHAATLAGSIAAYYKYADRTEVVDRSLRGTDAVLAELKRRIAFRLGMALKPVIDNPPQVIKAEDRTLVGPSGEPLPSIVLSPAGSEDYHNVLYAFIQSDLSDIIDYRGLSDARNSWCLWARYLSWAIFVLMVTEFASLISLGAAAKLFEVPVPKWVIGGSFALTTAIVLGGCLLPLACMLRLHDQITALRMRHAAP